MSVQFPRFTWRYTPQFICHYTRGRDLYLHRPDQEPVFLGGVRYRTRCRYTHSGNAWYWFLNEHPQGVRLDTSGWGRHSAHPYTGHAIFENRWEAMADLRLQKTVIHYPKKHCMFCGTLETCDCVEDPWNK